MRVRLCDKEEIRGGVEGDARRRVEARTECRAAVAVADEGRPGARSDGDNRLVRKHARHPRLVVIAIDDVRCEEITTRAVARYARDRPHVRLRRENEVPAIACEADVHHRVEAGPRARNARRAKHANNFSETVADKDILSRRLDGQGSRLQELEVRPRRADEKGRERARPRESRARAIRREADNETIIQIGDINHVRR